MNALDVLMSEAHRLLDEYATACAAYYQADIDSHRTKLEQLTALESAIAACTRVRAYTIAYETRDVYEHMQEVIDREHNPCARKILEGVQAKLPPAANIDVAA